MQDFTVLNVFIFRLMLLGKWSVDSQKLLLLYYNCFKRNFKLFKFLDSKLYQTTIISIAWLSYNFFHITQPLFYYIILLF